MDQNNATIDLFRVLLVLDANTQASESLQDQFLACVQAVDQPLLPETTHTLAEALNIVSTHPYPLVFVANTAVQAASEQQMQQLNTAVSSGTTYSIWHNGTSMRCQRLFSTVESDDGFPLAWLLDMARIQGQAHSELLLLRRKLANNRQYLDLVLDSSSDGFWDWDVNQGHVFFSKRWKAHLGYAYQEGLDEFMFWRDIIHPEDLGYFLVQFADYLETPQATNVKFEYRVKTQAGFYRWVQIRACKAVDTTANTVRLAGSHDDITERKEEERELLAYQKMLEDKVANHMRALEAANTKLAELASLDGLTGVYNRRTFDECLDREFRRSRRSGTPPLGLLMLDIDLFKAFNDTYGHLQGDECLKTIAHVLVDTVQRGGDFVARYGGEEFCVLLPSTSRDALLLMGSKIQAAIAGIKHLPKNPETGRRITLSIGGATNASGLYASPEQLIHGADEALYQAKRQGRDQIVLAKQLKGT